MFTGIIETQAQVVSMLEKEMSATLALKTEPADWQQGESIAVNGVCLTLAQFNEEQF